MKKIPLEAIIEVGLWCKVVRRLQPVYGRKFYIILWESVNRRQHKVQLDSTRIRKGSKNNLDLNHKGTGAKNKTN